MEKGVRFRYFQVSSPAQIEQSVARENHEAGDDRMPADPKLQRIG